MSSEADLDKDRNAEADSPQRFEQTVRRMLETPPKPHGAAAKKRPGKKAGPKSVPKK